MMFVGAVVGWFFWSIIVTGKAKKNPYGAVDLPETFLQAAVFVLAGAVLGYAVECFL